MTIFGWSFTLLHLPLILSIPYQSSGAPNSNETDRLALLEFKSRVAYDPFGVMASWNNSIDFCHWNGVTCGHRHKRVVTLDLRSQRLAGSISPHVGNLSFLRNLVLNTNSFTGQIPPELGRLRRLEVLDLANNSLVEEIPTNLSSCINLVNLTLSYNDLSGRIPIEIGSLRKLHKLSLRDNNLTGNIPLSLGNLSSLEVLFLNTNLLDGGIPYTLGQMKNLWMFGLGDNNFEGRIVNNEITVFAHDAEKASDIDPQEAQQTLQIAKDNLSKAEAEGQTIEADLALKQAELRVRAVNAIS